MPPRHRQAASVLRKPAEAQEVKDLQRQPAGDSAVHEKDVRPGRIPGHTWQELHAAIQSPPPQEEGKGEPEAADLANDEEPVLTLVLVQGHEEHRRLRGPNLPGPVGGENLSPADRLEVPVTRPHAEAVTRPEAVAVPHLHDPGQAP